MKRLAWKLGVLLALSVLRTIDSILPGAKQIRRGAADPQR